MATMLRNLGTRDRRKRFSKFSKIMALLGLSGQLTRPILTLFTVCGKAAASGNIIGVFRHGSLSDIQPHTIVSTSILNESKSMSDRYVLSTFNSGRLIW